MSISNKTIGIILISPTVIFILYHASVECIEFVYKIGLSGLICFLLNILIGIILSISLIAGCGYLLKNEEK